MDFATTKSNSSKIVMLDDFRNNHDFKWHIENFESRLDPQVQGLFLEREVYPIRTSQMNAHIVIGHTEENKSIWTFYLYARYNKVGYDKTYVSFHLDYSKRSKNISLVMGTISILTSDGTKANTKNFQFRCNYWELNELEFFILREDLLKNPAKFLENGTLTILCEISIWYNESLKELSSFGYPQLYKLDKNKLISDLKNLLQNKKSYEVTLSCIDSKLKAHKAILSARSPIFAAMFEHDTTENRTNIVNIEGSRYKRFLI